jgi:hypothetical protein
MRHLKVTPRFTGRTNSGNGFRDGVPCYGTCDDDALSVTVAVTREDGLVVRRSVGTDGGGGAHLQLSNNQPWPHDACHTEGHFEIKDIPLATHNKEVPG